MGVGRDTGKASNIYAAMLFMYVFNTLSATQEFQMGQTLGYTINVIKESICNTKGRGGFVWGLRLRGSPLKP